MVALEIFRGEGCIDASLVVFSTPYTPRCRETQLRKSPREVGALSCVLYGYEYAVYDETGGIRGGRSKITSYPRNDATWPIIVWGRAVNESRDMSWSARFRNVPRYFLKRDMKRSKPTITIYVPYYAHPQREGQCSTAKKLLCHDFFPSFFQCIRELYMYEPVLLYLLILCFLPQLLVLAVQVIACVRTSITRTAVFLYPANCFCLQFCSLPWHAAVPHESQATGHT